MRASVLVVDERDVASPQASLTQDGYAAAWVETAQEAIVFLTHTVVDVVVVEAQLPDGDALETCRWLREQGFAFPILVLSANAEELDSVVALD